MSITRSQTRGFALAAAIATAAACAKPQAPVSTPAPPPSPPTVTSSGASTPAPPNTPPSPPAVPNEPPAMTSRPYDGFTPEDWNDPAKTPLKPVFFHYDSDQIDDKGRAVLQDNARLLQEYPTLVLTIEGHCDERGTPEYNLALGERRALAAKSFLVSLGITGDRLQTVSYGKEFPFDPGRSEEAWSLNRRAHFMVTKK
jgi:peptidoglycan-associated lipoprotein